MVFDKVGTGTHSRQWVVHSADRLCAGVPSSPDRKGDIYEIEGKNMEDYALKLHQNIYGQKQVGRVWYK